MAGRFPSSRPGRRSASDPWFRLGQVDVGSAAFLALLCAGSIVVYGLEPIDKPILRRLALFSDDVWSGQVWRLLTWPLAIAPGERLFWTAVTVAVLWYFGSQVERQIGRIRMTVLLVALIVLPGIVATVLGVDAFGVRSIELAVLLIFVAENPHVRFFFGIPAWVLGLVYVVTDVLQISGARATDQLLLYLASLVIAALAARAVGMLGAYPWIPRVPLPDSWSGVRSSGPRRSRRGTVRGRTSGREVVRGPWTTTPSGTPPPRPTSGDQAAAQAELDALLDKISAGGLESLSPDEKRRLNELSKRLR